MKKLNYRELGVSSAAILLLSLVLAALPFTQNLSENTLRIGHRGSVPIFYCADNGAGGAFNADGSGRAAARLRDRLCGSHRSETAACGCKKEVTAGDGL